MRGAGRVPEGIEDVDLLPERGAAGSGDVGEFGLRVRRQHTVAIE